MKSVFNEKVRSELIHRITELNKDSKPNWGKMEVGQMIKHCVLWNEMAIGRITSKRTFSGFIFGKLALRKLIKDEKPVPKNMPTIPFLIIKDHEGDIESDKKKWIAQMNEYGQLDDYKIIHPFFGEMNKDQIGALVYKHTDHHLRQFNV